MQVQWLLNRSAVVVTCVALVSAGCDRRTDNTAGADSNRGPGTAASPGAVESPIAGATPGTRALSSDDAQFVMTASEGGMYEVAVGKLAADKASQSQVRSFGSMLVDHHGMANDKLKQIASAHAMTLPTSIPSDKQSKLDQLSQMSGAAFDRQFIDMVGIEDHRKDIAAFEKASRGATADDIRAFASETLPTLQSHLSEAQKLQSTLNKSGGAP